MKNYLSFLGNCYTLNNTNAKFGNMAPANLNAVTSTKIIYIVRSGRFS